MRTLVPGSEILGYLSGKDQKAQQNGITGRRGSSSASLLPDYSKVSRTARGMNTRMIGTPVQRGGRVRHLPFWWWWW